MRRGEASFFIDEHTLPLGDEDTRAVVQSLLDDGEHMKRGSFNSDFFIRRGQHLWGGRQPYHFR